MIGDKIDRTGNRYCGPLVVAGILGTSTGDVAAQVASMRKRVGGVPLANGRIKRVRGRTGYTHQWRTASSLARLCMASVDSEAEAREAQALGWRTFRVRLPAHAGRDDGLREARCPASAEAGKKLSCAQCLACGGGNRRGSIVIDAHGGVGVMANIRKAVA